MAGETGKDVNYIALNGNIRNMECAIGNLEDFIRDKIMGEKCPQAQEVAECDSSLPSLVTVLQTSPGRIREASERVNSIIGQLKELLLS